MGMSEATKSLRADKMRAQWARERAERSVERLSADPKATGDDKKAAKSLLAERKVAEKKAIAAFLSSKEAEKVSKIPAVEAVETAEAMLESISESTEAEESVPTPEDESQEAPEESWPQGGPGNTEPPTEVDPDLQAKLAKSVNRARGRKVAVPA